MAPDPPKREPISPAVRRRLQACFERGNQVSGQGNYDYATDLYSQCILGDASNKLYAQNFLSNLQKKYNNNKKGSKFGSVTGAGHRTMVRKAAVSKDWAGMIKAGLEVLKLNPWDTAALIEVGRAEHELENDDTELVFLKAAIDTNLRDPELNRAYGRALGRQGHFDEAITCWQRVLAGKGKDEEASRAIADLTVERTIKKGGYETAESSNEVKADKGDDAQAEYGAMTPERQLERAIEKNPADPQNYVRLFEIYQQREIFDEAEKYLVKAIEVSGGDLNLKERLEDLRLRRVREQVDIAQHKSDAEKTAEAQQLLQRFRVELNNHEIEYYRVRAERYAANLSYKYELGVRLQRAGNYVEAIKQYQQALGDPQRKGLVLLALGRCFLKIKQAKLAMRNLEAAVEILGERDLDARKLALYLTGCLAMELKDLDKAEHFLTELAGMEFDYKDVSQRLDKINELRDKG